MSTETFLPDFLKPERPFNYLDRRGNPNTSWIKSIMLPEYKSDEVLCLHPRIIVNPLLPELLAKYRVLNPLPSFEGEPKLVGIPNDMDEFANLVWTSLNEDNKVSLFIRFIDIETGKYETKIFNKNK